MGWNFEEIRERMNNFANDKPKITPTFPMPVEHFEVPSTVDMPVFTLPAEPSSERIHHSGPKELKPLQVPKLPDPPSSKLDFKITEPPQVPKFPDLSELDLKIEELRQFNVPKAPTLQPFQAKPSTTSVKFNDPSAGFSQHGAVTQEEKDNALKKAEERARKTLEKDKAIRTTVDESKKARESSGFSSWSKQQTEAEKTRKDEEVAEKSRKEAEKTNKNMKEEYHVSVRKSASEVEEESRKQAREIENNMRWRRESKNGIGPDNEKGYVSSAVGGTSRSWRKNHTNEENRFIDARRYYSKNLGIIKNQKSRLSEAKQNFLNEYKDESMISDESMGKMQSAFEEAKAAHDQEVLEARRAGRETPKLDNKKIDSQIAQKVFGQATDKEISAVGYMRTKTNAEGLIGRAQKRNDILGRYIDSAQEKGEQKIARGPKAGHSGWKGKAAIFGGVAMAALATVGVANLAMSGGRQSNSNLYNPYQAMY